MKFYKLTAIMLLCVAITGCNRQEPNATVEIDDNLKYTSRYVREFKLKDGTRCASYYRGAKAGGLSCDWGAAE